MLRDVRSNVTDGLLGFATATGDGLHIKIGVSPSVTEKPITILGSMGASTIKSKLGLSPLADAVMDAVQGGAARVFCIPVAASTAGTIGEVTKTGDGGGSVTVQGSPNNAYALTVRYMVDELTRDYIKLARVKGLSSREIMFKHVLRNAMVPMVQYIPQSILLTVGGSLLMERFFSVPGMGPLLTDAIQRYDLNVVQTLVILYAVLGIVGVFLGDVLMMVVDPRITLTGKEEAR